MRGIACRVPQSLGISAEYMATRARPDSIGLFSGGGVRNNAALGFAAFFVGCLALNVAAVMIPSFIWAIGALLGFGVLMLLLARNAAATFILLLPLIVLRATEYISGVAIESGAYMTETRLYGEATGAFARLLFFHGALFVTAALTIEPLWPRIAHYFALPEDVWNRRLRVVATVVFGTLLLCSIYLVSLGLAEGLPLLTGEDRFAFRWRIDSMWLDAFINNRVVFAPLFGLLLITKGYRPLGVVALLWLLFLSLAIGEKFTSLVNISTSAAIPIGLAYIAKGRKLPIAFGIKAAVALSLLVVPAVLVAYGALSNFDQAMNRFGERVSLQGQLWFVSDRENSDIFAWDGDALSADIATWFDADRQSATAVGTDFGLYYVMSDYTQSQELRWIMETGNGFVFAQQPYLLKATGYFGLLVITCLMSLYTALVMLALAFVLGRADVLSIILAGRVFVFLIGYYIGGWFWNVFGFKNLIAIGLLLLAMWLHRFRFSLR